MNLNVRAPLGVSRVAPVAVWVSETPTEPNGGPPITAVAVLDGPTRVRHDDGTNTAGRDEVTLSGHGLV